MTDPSTDRRRFLRAAIAGGASLGLGLGSSRAAEVTGKPGQGNNSIATDVPRRGSCPGSPGPLAGTRTSQARVPGFPDETNPARNPWLGK